MLQWKQNSQGKSALMIDGARRIGKRILSLSSRIGTICKQKHHQCYLAENTTH